MLACGFVKDFPKRFDVRAVYEELRAGRTTRRALAEAARNGVCGDEARFEFWPVPSPAGPCCVLGVDFTSGAAERPNEPELFTDVVAATGAIGLDRSLRQFAICLLLSKSNSLRPHQGSVGWKYVSAN